MSDDPPIDYVAVAVSRDQRFADLARAIAVENDLANNETIKALIAHFRHEMEEATKRLCDISPVDAVAISHCLVDVRAFVHIKRCLELVLTRGKIAEADIRNQDMMHSDE